VYKRGLKGPSTLSPILIPRLKRVIKAPARFDKTISKASRKKDKGKRRQI
jgi:hypothetical protein